MTDSKTGFGPGMAGPFRGIRFLLEHPRLFIYLVIPWFFTMAAIFVLWRFGDVYSERLQDWIWMDPGSTWLKPLYWLYDFTWFFVFLVLIAFSGFLAGQILAAPVYTKLALETRRDYLGHAEEPGGGFMADFVYPIVSQVVKVFLLVIVQTLLLLLNIVPGIGTVIQFVLSPLVTMFWISLDYFDFPLDTESDPLHVLKRINYVFEHSSTCFGFSIVMFAILMIPLVNIIVLPVGVIGATLLHCDLTR